MTLIEKMARAIYDHAASKPPGKPNWDGATEDVREWIRGHARAAIQAMREPTPGMIGASVRNSELGGVASSDLGGAFGLIEELWQAMIDQAIKEGE